MYLSVFCLLFAFGLVNVTEAAADYNTQSAELGSFFTSKQGTVDEIYLGNPGYYSICTGKICAMYKKNKESTADDDQLIALADKDNIYTLNKYLPKNGVEQAAFINEIAKDPNAAASLNSNDSYFETVQTKVAQSNDNARRIEELKKRIAEDDFKNGEEQTAALKELADLENEKSAIDNQIKPSQKISGQRRAEEAKLENAELSGVGLGACNPFSGAKDLFANPSFGILKCLNGILELISGIVSFILAIAGKFFDYVIRYTIVDFSTHVDGSSSAFKKSIESVWTLIKNLSNLIFIGVLLYIAVKTILQGDGFQERQRLINVIIFAFLINFSMFFTKLLIDVSNTASVELYNVITTADSVQEQNGLAVNTGGRAASVIANFTSSPLSDAFLSGMRITKFAEGVQLTEGAIALRQVMNIILVLVAACIFVAAGMMFIVRFFTLILLMMTSPIAYSGRLWPITEQVGQMWWSKFKENLLFAPAYMVMVYASLQLISFTSQSLLEGSNPIDTLMMYSISMTSMIACLIVAQKVGGSAAAAGWGINKAKGVIGGLTFGLAARAGRRVIGGAGSSIANSSFLKKVGNSNNLLLRATGASALARATKKQGAGLAEKTFDLRNTSAGKAIGLDGGIKDGYDKGIKEVKDKLAKDKIEAEKKKAEPKKEEKDRINLQQAADSTQKGLDSSLDTEREQTGYLHTISDELHSVETALTADLANRTSQEAAATRMVNEEILKIDDELHKLTQQENRNNTKLANPNTSPLEAQRLREANSDIASRRTGLGSRRTSVSDKLSVVNMDNTIREFETKARENIKTLSEEKAKQEKVVDAAQKNAANARARHDDVNARLKAAGYDRDTINTKVAEDYAKRQDRERKYLDYLSSISNPGFWDSNAAYIGSRDKYQDALRDAMRDYFKNQNDKDLDKLISRINSSNTTT